MMYCTTVYIPDFLCEAGEKLIETCVDMPETTAVHKSSPTSIHAEMTELPA